MRQVARVLFAQSIIPQTRDDNNTAETKDNSRPGRVEEKRQETVTTFALCGILSQVLRLVFLGISGH